MSAKHLKTFQSSTYGGRRRKYYSSAQAVDGLSKTFSMTKKVRRVIPYWYVDLGGTYTIRRIAYYNTAIPCLPHISNFDQKMPKMYLKLISSLKC
jgi:hypothetical protein